ncbi:hypothetical protein [Candidatus Poriferisodalis sp.]|nr:hypothetical protein [Acidimicrobiaceae bacterium]MDE0320118.1 hypothetical protein [Acidimicrobiaceae bacterium]MDE0498139.1 hypothetical protein [Acidimicrobiaceae bacterium]
MREPTEPSAEDRTNRDGFAAMAILAMTIVFIVAIIVFAIA